MPQFKADATGRSTFQLARSKDKESANPWPNESFIRLGITLLQSAAYRTLSLAAKNVLDRIMIEHLSHAGRINGKLPCTYSDFERHGVRRQSVAKALDELQALGFIELIRRGHLRPEGESGSPSLYKLTFESVNLPDRVVAATHEWKQFATIEQCKNAKLAFHACRKTERSQKFARSMNRKIQKSSV